MADPHLEIDEATVLRLASLAELEVTAAEASGFAEDLRAIVGHVREIQGLDLEGIEPTSFISFGDAGKEGGEEGGELRQDLPRPELSHQQALQEAPAAFADGFSVPSFVDEG